MPVTVKKDRNINIKIIETLCKSHTNPFHYYFLSLHLEKLINLVVPPLLVLIQVFSSWSRLHSTAISSAKLYYVPFVEIENLNGGNGCSIMKTRNLNIEQAKEPYIYKNDENKGLIDSFIFFSFFNGGPLDCLLYFFFFLHALRVVSGGQVDRH